MKNILLKAALPHLAAIALFLVANALFFAPTLSGKVLKQGDIISWNAAVQESREVADGEQVLWTNSMFGGMPMYQISYSPKGYHISFLTKNLLTFRLSDPINQFYAMMLGFYVLMLILGVHPLIGMAGALAFGFSTSNLILLEAGHSNKLWTVAYMPFIIGGLYLMYYKRKYLIGGTLFALALGANLGANHIQMTYYFAMTIAVLGILWIVESARSRSWKPLLLTGAIALAGAALALGATLSNLWPTYEYSQDTMRGKPILSAPAPGTENSAAQGSSSNTDGLDWDYAMQWSNGSGDLLASFIPRAVGGGSSEPLSSGATYTTLKQSGAATSPDGSIALPLYWGELPFTSGPIYFGAVIVFLFLLGVFLIKGSFKWWAFSAVALTLLISLGKNAEFFQRLLFDYLPLYNKFRTPNSVLTITAFFFPLLAAYALSVVVKNEYDAKTTEKALFWAGGISGGLALLLALLGPSLFAFSSPGDANYQPELVALLKQDRESFLSKDAWRSFGLIAVSFGLIYAYLQRAVSATVLIACVGLLAVGDLWSVGRRYIRPDNFVTQTEYGNQFAERPADQQIRSIEKSRGEYRVLDLSVGLTSSTLPSYYHNTVGGYSAAKLQRYQDLIDFHISKMNVGVLNMLNTKYIITQDGQVQPNPGALGTAWFVDNVQVVQSPDAEIRALDSLNTGETAVILDQEFNNYIGGFDPAKGGSISLKSYNPQHLVYSYDAPSEQLAVFSEIWYGPDKGWKAYLDGKEVDHIRANYVLRAMRVPAGKHEIAFRFEPRSVELGGLVSGASSLLLIFGFLGVSVFQLWRWSKNPVIPDWLSLPKRAESPSTPKAERSKTAALPKKRK
ncbi:MAG: YfhO family protein [Saprospiraceae bacterium]